MFVLDNSYMSENRKIFGQVVCSFRYGREADEIMGLNFQKELYLASEQLYPPTEKMRSQTTKLQERLQKKLGPNAFPFTFEIPASAPASVILQKGKDDTGSPCGVEYYVKLFCGESETDRTHRRSTVTLGIRKVQYAPSKQGSQPMTIVRKDFMLSPGELELEVTLDKQLYIHEERIAVNICIRNNSNKVRHFDRIPHDEMVDFISIVRRPEQVVKKIKAMVQQGVDVVLFQNGQYRNTVASMETSEGCPIQPGSSVQKVMYLVPTLRSNLDRAGIALDGTVRAQDANLASSTL